MEDRTESIGIYYELLTFLIISPFFGASTSLFKSDPGLDHFSRSESPNLG